VAAVFEDDGKPLSVGRRRRTVPTSIRRALKARDGRCRFPGCEARRWVDAHHVHHWAQGGETSLENLILLCRRHHRLVHEGGYRVSLSAGGEPAFRDRWGTPIPRVPASPTGTMAAVARRFGEAERPEILTGTGERMDLGLAVDAVLAATGET